LSVYRHRSEVSRLNALAATAPLRVESRLFRLLQQSVQLYVATEGAFDITAGPLIKAWGFYHREGRLPTEEALQEALQRVGAQSLQLDADHETVFYSRPGLEINLGAIGKGYALDRCAELLRTAEIDNFMVHGGHSTILAFGKRQRGESRHGWNVALRHPLRPDRHLAEVLLRNRALATSGSGTQHFYAQGRRYGHILDPRTGQPAAHVVSATVLARNAAEADALSTAFYVMGLEKSRDYCDHHPEVAALLSCPGPRAGTLELHCYGLADDEWRRISE
jgi:thiamine biosynthesis lipoprotein